MNANIIILLLHLIQISLKFYEEIRYLIRVPQKSCKKNVVLSAIPNTKDEKKLYAEIY